MLRTIFASTQVLINSSYNKQCGLCVVDMGIQIEQGLYIARIVPGSTVAKEGMLSTGDRIICVSIDRQT